MAILYDNDVFSNSNCLHDIAENKHTELPLSEYRKSYIIARKDLDNGLSFSINKLKVLLHKVKSCIRNCVS